MNNEKSSYTVKDIMAILNISKTHAYEFVNNNPPFRVLRAGKCLRIPKIGFDTWFAGNTEHNAPDQKLAKLA